jgi:transcriptional regulator with XRE-family HTH domain
MNLDILSRNIAATRDHLSMSQRQFAVMMGVSTATVVSYEAGERAPSLEFVLKLSTVAKVPVETLCEGVVTGASIESEALRVVKKKLAHLDGELHRIINTL